VSLALVILLIPTNTWYRRTQGLFAEEVAKQLIREALTDKDFARSQLEDEDTSAR
jgi:hypothetical protein